MFRLDGKVALVTGGSRGIGRSCSEALASQGATVVINYVRGEAQARETAEAIAQKGGKAEIAGFDVGDTASTETAIADIVKRHGRLDILVANAGIAIDGLLLRAKDEDFDKLFHINVRGAITCARCVVSPMGKKKTGRIIFLSSVVADLGNAGQTLYGATKAAVTGAAKSIAREYASRNITANVIAPGFIDTEMTSAITDDMKQQLLRGIPLGRTGTPQEIAAACVFLASDEASYVTGQVLRVNGGMYG